MTCYAIGCVTLRMTTRHNCVRDSTFCRFLDLPDVTHATPLVDIVVASQLWHPIRHNRLARTTLVSSKMVWYHIHVDLSIMPATHQIFSDMRQRRITISAVTDLSCDHRRRIQFFYQQDAFVRFLLHRHCHWQRTETVRIATASVSLVVDLVLVPTQSDRLPLYAGRCRNRNLLRFTKQRH